MIRAVMMKLNSLIIRLILAVTISRSLEDNLYIELIVLGMHAVHMALFLSEFINPKALLEAEIQLHYQTDTTYYRIAGVIFVG